MSCRFVARYEKFIMDGGGELGEVQADTVHELFAKARKLSGRGVLYYSIYDGKPSKRRVRITRAGSIAIKDQT